MTVEEALQTAGDGVTDDRQALQAAIDAAHAGGQREVALPAGTFLVSAALRIPSGVTLHGSGTETIIASSSTEEPAIMAAGELGPLQNLAQDAPAGTTEIPIGASDVDYTNALLWLQSNATTRTQPRAEIAVVASAAGDRLTLSAPLADDYLVADGARWGVLAPVTDVAIRDLAVRNTNYASEAKTKELILLLNVARAELSGLALFENNHAGIRLEHAIDVQIDRCAVRDLRDDLERHLLGYGVAVGGASRRVKVSNSTFETCRHGFTTTNVQTGTPYGVPREVTVESCRATGTSSHGLDTHEEGLDLALIGNAVNDVNGFGINVRASRVLVQGNTVEGAQAIGIHLADKGTDNQVRDNTVRNTRPKPNGRKGDGIVIEADRSVATGNRVSGSAESGIRIGGEAPLAEVTVTDNQLDDNESGIRVEVPVDRLAVSGNSVSGGRWTVSAAPAAGGDALAESVAAANGGGAVAPARGAERAEERRDRPGRDQPQRERPAGPHGRSGGWLRRLGRRLGRGRF